MLKQQYRLKKSSAFNATYRVKHSYCVSGVVLWVGSKKKPEYACSSTRVGFVVGKKTHKRAVRRNRLKRLMRENYRQLLKDGKIAHAQQFISLIFVGMQKSLDKDFSQMKEIMLKLLSNLDKP